MSTTVAEPEQKAKYEWNEPIGPAIFNAPLVVGDSLEVCGQIIVVGYDDKGEALFKIDKTQYLRLIVGDDLYIPVREKTVDGRTTRTWDSEDTRPWEGFE